MSQDVAVIVATRGRPEIVARLAARLAAQSRRPDEVVVVATEPADVGALPAGATVLYGEPGLSSQRNRGLARLGGRFAHVVFFDDDFVPSRFWLERMMATFAGRPALLSLTGEVLADGAMTQGLPWDEAERLVDDRDAAPPAAPTLREGVTPYGCNMAFRASGIAGETFDERLVLYAWQEDADFGARIARRGAVAWTNDLWGVHMGAKSGRTPGVRLGYSQIVNPLYLTAKGSLTAGYSARLMTRNLVANAVKSLRPEPFVDRRGRLKGNLIGLRDALRGRIDPERAREL